MIAIVSHCINVHEEKLMSYLGIDFEIPILGWAKLDLWGLGAES